MEKVLIILAGLVLMGVMGGAFADGTRKPQVENQKTLKKATFAGGCFWCMEPPFDQLGGVVSTIVGYAGGTEENPTYQEVASGKTGHAEAIEILYDSTKITYRELLDVFWRNIDPTQKDGQFVDKGRQYRPAIFFHNDDQRREAEKSRETLGKSGRFAKRIVTEIVPATAFYRAEEYHQDYYKKSPFRYKFYRFGSGRDQFLKKVWGDKV